MIAGNRIWQTGFTLIELLVALAIAIILATIAVPSFQGLVRSNRMASDYNAILSGLNSARSEAINRRVNVTAELITFEGSGWKLEVKQVSSGEILKVREAIGSPVILEAEATIIFNSLGNLTPPACKEVKLVMEGLSESIWVWSSGQVGEETCRV